MNANYLYDIFETAIMQGQPLDIAAESVPAVEGLTKREAIDFINLHYDPLWRAYATGNRKLFDDILAVCVKGNEHEVEALEQAYATGNEKLIADFEARFGGERHV